MFNSPPDYENATDTGDNNVYELTVTARDAAGNDETQDVVVRVTNVEEDGVIELSTLAPQEDVLITATLSDSDEIDEDTVTWQWARSTRATGPWTTIEWATTNSYTPGDFDSQDIPDNYASDVGMYLRVTATYRDGFCPSCNMDTTAQVITDNAVLAKAYVNQAPKFLDEHGVEIPTTGSTTRTIAENSAVGTAVGAPVRATDPGRDGPEVLTYSISGNNASLFFHRHGYRANKGRHRTTAGLR